MKLFDTHMHLDMEPLSNDIEGAIERAHAAGVTHMINVGSSMRGSRVSLEIANNYPNIWASVGIHPHDAETLLDLETKIDELAGLAASDEVVAIGEIGLDYFYLEGNLEKARKAQRELFATQLGLARELKKPVIVHVRDAWKDTFDLFRETKFSGDGVIHCFTGGEMEAKTVLDMGFFLGYTGFVTFGQEKFSQIRRAVSVTPLDKILIETDAPFLAPEPYRGKTNEPAFVLEVAKKIAEIKGISVEEVAKTTANNAKLLFNIS